MKDDSITRKLCADSICCPRFIFLPHPQQFRRVRQVVRGIGPVPELMLPPQARGHRQKRNSSIFGQIRGI